MSIQSDVKELQDLDSELKRLGKQMKILRDRKNVIENKIKIYLDEKDQPGVKYQDLAIIMDNKKGRIRINEKEKKERVLEILNSNGVENSEEMLNELIETMKGTPVNKSYIKLQKIKNLRKN